MKLEQISVNLYSLSPHLQTREDFETSMARLSAIGFKSVQLSGCPADLMPEAEFVATCARHGLAITATHEPADKVINDPQWSISRLKRLGVTETAYPFPAGVDFADEAGVLAWIDTLEARRQLFAADGIRLTYHNHHREFTHICGKTVMEHLFERTDMAFEIDTYWVQYGGVDPVKLVRKLAEAGRLPLIHLKDLRITAAGDVQYAELGGGNLDFSAIIDAASQGDCLSYIIEQDDTFGRDRFEAIAESFNYLRDNFLS